MAELRKIIHIDMDAFFASVEQRDFPELRGKPIAIGRAEMREVVSTASYEARQFGVRSAMPSLKALKLCPQLIFVPGRMSVYKAVSRQIREIFHRYTDLVEPLSIDEAFLDVTENKQGVPVATELAKLIKEDIWNELHLTASAGISYNKFLAKLASDMRKPDGICTIHPSRAQAVIDKLPVESFWGVGKATASKMKRLGILSGADLRSSDLALLIRHFGKMGLLYHQFAQGIDNRPVDPTRVRKSVGCEQTYPVDVSDEDLQVRELPLLSQELVRRLQRSGFRGNTLTLKLKFPDFTQRTCSITVPETLLTVEDILPLAQQLALQFASRFETSAQRYRLVGLSVSHPIDENDDEWEQLWLDLQFHDDLTQLGK